MDSEIELGKVIEMEVKDLKLDKKNFRIDPKGVIDWGVTIERLFDEENIIEIVPTKRMADQMSSGVSYFEQIKWDLENRGVADIDIPVIVMGIDG